MADRSPVLTTLALLVAVFALQLGLWVAGMAGVLALSADVAARPWALVTSIYAHAGPGHLVANLVALAIVGPFVSRRTTALRFHAYFLLTGAIAVFAEVAVGAALGEAPVVLGASGAIFALAGYLLAGNVLTSAILDRVSLSRRTQLVVLVVVVVGLTVVTGSSRAALVAHAVGLTIGLVAGRLRVLDVSESDDSGPDLGTESDLGTGRDLR